MENSEEIYNFLEDFTKRKPKVIPQELNDYLSYVARTGDPVYQWSLVKSLFKEKLLNVITDFYETSPGAEIPLYPNVDPFNYDSMKNSLLERLDSFNSAPFTVQRICELLIYPRKQYNRIDKFMRAIEKNILVVSTREPGVQRPAELDNGEPEAMEPIVNGSDNSEYNVDVEMEDATWKENEQNHIAEPQPSSSDTLISVDDIETRLQAKETPMQEKMNEYESLTPPELEVASNEAAMKVQDEEVPLPISADVEPMKVQEEIDSAEPEAIDPLGPGTNVDTEMKTEVKEVESVVIPEIKIDDAEMTEKRLCDEQNIVDVVEKINEDVGEKEVVAETKEEIQPALTDENSSSNTKEDTPKMILEVLTSSEESSSSSDNTEGNSNSPKPQDATTEPQESNEALTEPQVINETTTKPQEINKATTAPTVPEQKDATADLKTEVETVIPEPAIEAEPSINPEENIEKDSIEEVTPPVEIEKVDMPILKSDNYSVADVDSELPQPAEETEKPEEKVPEVKVGVLVDVDNQIQGETKEEIQTADGKETE